MTVRVCSSPMADDQLSRSRRAVRDFTNKGLTPRDISILLNISTQRVYHHLKKLEMKPAKQTKAAIHETWEYRDVS